MTDRVPADDECHRALCERESAGSADLAFLLTGGIATPVVMVGKILPFAPVFRPVRASGAR
ncbi:hypothetical protein CDV50_11255 [Haematobacter massiliensis]|uniref:Uncharacterized protein n=1 Tax=Haematobacter massiliensis TaxID=195105 RepID=A0A086Y8T7_9RHOB|nr:hypothetical protein [Haematobacter massiliensis]KFI30687.1 hypothetical protein CN97_12760 [Haematobacter massiliensis]OWJ70904.1 hypothetical protein CDV50_11255 [Haematobacter massiliensis]OWJ87444.1 hypothetical protein CDV51_06870 [Haematobacter massiliensis]QBJ24898.1 hypothetical protein HmaOT1_11975 [Haematobacter massiliensis]